MKRLAVPPPELINEDQQQCVNAEIDHVVDDDDEKEISIRHSKVTPQQLGEIVLLVEDNVVSATMAKKLLTLLYQTNDPTARPRDVATVHGLQLVTDTVQLEQICQAVIQAHPDLVDVYRNGGKFVTKMHQRFTGLAMEASHGNAHPERLREILFAALQVAAAEDPATKSV